MIDFAGAEGTVHREGRGCVTGLPLGVLTGVIRLPAPGHVGQRGSVERKGPARRFRSRIPQPAVGNHRT